MVPRSGAWSCICCSLRKWSVATMEDSNSLWDGGRRGEGYWARRNRRSWIPRWHEWPWTAQSSRGFKKEGDWGKYLKYQIFQLRQALELFWSVQRCNQNEIDVLGHKIGVTRNSDRKGGKYMWTKEFLSNEGRHTGIQPSVLWRVWDW